MRVFLDTNIIMKYLCNRANYRLAKEILNAAYLQISQTPNIIDSTK